LSVKYFRVRNVLFILLIPKQILDEYYAINEINILLNPLFSYDKPFSWHVSFCMCLSTLNLGNKKATET
jgi:hypothetical protein